jgi:hypothetical protein
MGEVWGGYDRQLERRVAVKLIRFPDGKYDEQLRRRFLTESKVLARLAHPGAPAVYDAGTFEDPLAAQPRLFMVMEFVEGQNVDILAGEHHPLPIGWAVPPPGPRRAGAAGAPAAGEAACGPALACSTIGWMSVSAVTVRLVTTRDVPLPAARMVKVDHVRRLALSLPRTEEKLIRDRIKFRVGRIVYLAMSPDETLMGFAFPKEERAALVAAEPEKFLMPIPSDERFNWVRVRLAAIDEPEMRELVMDAWRMVVPKRLRLLLDQQTT